MDDDENSFGMTPDQSDSNANLGVDPNAPTPPPPTPADNPGANTNTQTQFIPAATNVGGINTSTPQVITNLSAPGGSSTKDLLDGVSNIFPFLNGPDAPGNISFNPDDSPITVQKMLAQSPATFTTSSGTPNDSSNTTPSPSSTPISDAITKAINGVSGDQWAKTIGGAFSTVVDAVLKNRQLNISQQTANDNSMLAQLRAQQQANTSSAAGFNLGILGNSMRKS